MARAALLRARSAAKAAAPVPDVAAQRRQVVQAFGATLNLSAVQMSSWLATADSRRVRWMQEGDAESSGSAFGRRILELLRTDEDALTPADVAHMNKVLGHIHLLMAQRPQPASKRMAWRNALMNLGHDPML